MSKLIASTLVFLFLSCGAAEDKGVDKKTDKKIEKTKVEYTHTEIRGSIQNLKFQQEQLKEQWIKIQGQIDLLEAMLVDSTHTK